jgi:ATP-binding cassette subfamily F protein uup
LNYLTLENVEKSYGEKLLFKIDSLYINKGEKLALIAKNGSGKTSLLNLIAGDQSAEGEHARILIRKDLRIAYLKQDPDFNPNWTIQETVFLSDNPKMKAVMAYEAAVASKDEQRIQKTLVEVEDQKAWDTEAQVKEVLSKLKITQLDQKVGTLSGGQKKRLALAQQLLKDPEFLILDEPTNHLDVEMIEWLENYLKNPNLSLFLVTHDRYFMERLCNEIVELDNGRVFTYKGNYSDFLEKKSMRSHTEQSDHDKNKKLFKKELEWIRRQPKARGTKAKSRVDKFKDIKEKNSQNVSDDRIKFVFRGERLGSKILEIYHLEHAFGDIKIVEEFNYKFNKGERVGVIGPNGTGKTTLVKLLTAQLKPNGGKVIVGDTVKFGVFEQRGLSLKRDMRVVEVIRDVGEYIVLEDGFKLSAEKLLEKFLFNREQQQIYVSQLSGGEKRRLYLLQVLMQNPNFLILDEPTNDLDIITLNILEDFLIDFPGCLLIVTHDRYFMDKIVQHLFVMEGNGRVQDFNGNYSDYLERRHEFKTNEKKPEKEVKKVLPKAKKGMSYKEKREMEQIEKRIEALEKRQAEISSFFADPNMSSDEMNKLSIESSAISIEIQEKEERWMELAEMA